MGSWGAHAEGDGWSASASGDRSEGRKGGCLVIFFVLSPAALAALGAVAWGTAHLV